MRHVGLIRCRDAACVILMGSFLVCPAPGQSGGDYDLTWSTVDGGGGISSGGSYSLSGTTGQPDAAWSEGGTYELLGGFWPGGPVGRCPCLGDMNNDVQIDLEDLQMVAGILLDAGSPFVLVVDQGHCGDLNTDGQADLEDLQILAGILLDAGSPFIVSCE
jgi:hypothetical protein